MTTTILRSIRFFLFAALPMTTHAFIFNAFAAYPSLQEHAKAQTDCELNIRLDIGDDNKNNNNAARFVLDGLSVNLLQNKAKSHKVPLPGASGPHPQTSSGAKQTKVLQLPYFIGLKGLQQVALEDGVWEMVWREHSPSGQLICGFDVPQEAVRNRAKLPAGRLYLAFPIFTQELLAQNQATKAQVEEKAQEFRQELQDKLLAMQQTDNLWKKAWYYRDAAQAHEKLDMSGYRSWQWVPNPDQVVPIQDGLLVGIKGYIWSKAHGMFAPKVDIGTAMIRPVENDDNKNTLLP